MKDFELPDINSTPEQLILFLQTLQKDYSPAVEMYYTLNSWKAVVKGSTHAEFTNDDKERLFQFLIELKNSWVIHPDVK